MKFRDFAEGEMLLIDKPEGWTSFDVVKKVKHLIRTKKTGHAGTLDPMATGLLILCTGKWTKKIDEYQAQEKEYEGTFTIGARTASYDRETPAEETFDIKDITEERIREAAKKLTGHIKQQPPAYSALKVNGKRAYDLARQGKEVLLREREVEVRVFEITRIALPEVDFKIVCSKGTYIRSLAHDLGLALGNGAYLSRLVRTRIGEFLLADALSLKELAGYIESNALKEA
jgi:tRNA pseudouridine55 synthase